MRERCPACGRQIGCYANGRFRPHDRWPHRQKWLPSHYGKCRGSGYLHDKVPAALGDAVPRVITVHLPD